MSDYRPKVGDRVRVVVEGMYYDWWGTGIFLDGENTRIDKRLVVSIEKVTPPLPTTPGSVVRYVTGNYTYLLTTDGWVSRNNTISSLVLAAQDQDDIEVIFDAGQVTP